MKALKCDVCGSFYDYNKREITGFAFLNVGRSAIGDCSDICPECYKAIKKALDDRRKIRISDPNDDDLK